MIKKLIFTGWLGSGRGGGDVIICSSSVLDQYWVGIVEKYQNFATRVFSVDQGVFHSLLFAHFHSVLDTRSWIGTGIARFLHSFITDIIGLNFWNGPSCEHAVPEGPAHKELSIEYVLFFYGKFSFLGLDKDNILII